MSAKRSARRTFLIMVAVFAVPYGLAWFLYMNPQFFDLGSRSHGTLINPMVVPEAVPFRQENGQAFPAQNGNEKKWTLLMFGSTDCDEICEKTLFTLQQLRKMMAVDKARLKRAYMLLAGDNTEQISQTLGRYQGTELFIAERARISRLEEQLGVQPGTLEQHIVIADPMGNLVMLYPRDIEPKKIFADIEILFGRVKGI